LYGNLSPEVRKEEAKRFRDGESDILVATDAIAMGLNLPIKTLLFTTDRKFDGKEKRLLKPNEVIQISGRAGRYGHHEIGHIGATSKSDLAHIDKMFHSPMPTIKAPVRVKATQEQVEQLATHLNTKNLTKILKYFLKHMRYDGPFRATNIKNMLELSVMLDTKQSLSLSDKYMLSSAPINTRSPLIKNGYIKYVNAILKNKVVKYEAQSRVKGIAKTQQEMLVAEDEVKKISLYLWLSYKFPEIFPDKEKAMYTRVLVNNFCENSLKSNKKLQPIRRDRSKTFHKKSFRKDDKRDDDKKHTNRRRYRSRHREK